LTLTVRATDAVAGPKLCEWTLTKALNRTWHSLRCCLLFGHPLSLRRAILFDFISGGGVLSHFSFVFSATQPYSFLALSIAGILFFVLG
jgi:hypothetical protein